MLNFEEEAKANPMSGLAIPPQAGFVPQSQSADQRFAAGNAHRRITVEDKRIIKSKADVNQLTRDDIVAPADFFRTLGA